MSRGFFIVIFILIFSKIESQDLKWMYKIGGTTAEYGNGVAIDSDQNIYDITNFMGTVSVAVNVFYSSKGAEDILIRKSTSLGFQQWFRQIGGSKSDISYSISTDVDDNVFVAGTFSDTLYFGNTAIQIGAPDKTSSFILKINTDGVLLWSRKFESNISVTAKCITGGLAEELVVTGNFEGTAVFEQNQVPFTATSNGGNDIFILKMHGATGQILNLKKIGGSDHEYVQQHTRDVQNNIYLTGDFRQVLDFNPGPGENILSPKGLTDVFVLKLSSAATFIWARSYGGSNVDYGQSIVTDGQKNVIVTGRYSETVSFGILPSQIHTSKGGTDAFVCKLDENGNILWVDSFGDTQNDQGNKVITNSGGIIYVAGLFRGKVDFNPAFERKNESESKGAADFFVVLLNQDGTYNDHFALGGIANDQINDIKLKQNGELISVGGFGAIVDFDPTSSEINIISSGGLDAYLLNIFICVNPYLKEVKAIKPEICKGDRGIIQITEAYLNGATQWSWQRDSCTNITFASGNFLDRVLYKSASFFVKGSGGCVQNDQCTKIDIQVFTDTLKYQNFDLCQGDTIKIGSSKYTGPGVFVDSLLSRSGCDSVIVTEINMFPKYKFIQSFNICPGDTVRVGTSKYTFAGTFVNKFASVNGCDSSIITTITLKSSKIENAEVIICDGKSVQVGNATYSAAGTYIQTSVGSNGCEDLLIVKVIVLQTKFYQDIHLCEGDTLKIGSHNYTVNGDYIDSLTSTFGCDSIIFTGLSFSKKSFSQSEYAICEGDSVRVGNKIYRTTGNYIDTLINFRGCDSIVYSDIRVLKVPQTVLKRYDLCEGESVKIGNNTYSQTGVYRDTLVSKNGCDSTVISIVKIYQKLHFLKSKICFGDTVYFGGTPYSSSGLYSKEFKNIYNCDSIVVLSLEVIPKILRTYEHVVCPGDSVVIGNSLYTLPGIYVDTFSSVDGCDSIVTSIVKWNHVTNNLTYAFCRGDSLILNNVIYKEGGLYSDTLAKSDGCDSIINIAIKILPVYLTDTLFQICLGGQVKVGNSTYFNEGEYAELLTSKSGCDSMVHFSIEIINFTPDFYHVKDTLKSTILTGNAYQWYECSNGFVYAIPGAQSSKYVISKSGQFLLSVTKSGCSYFTSCKDVIATSTNNSAAYKLKYYPNPADNLLYIENENFQYVQVKSILGESISKQILFTGKNEIDVSFIKPGIYILEVSAEGRTQEYKFIKN